MAAEWLVSGAADEVTLRWNREAFDRIGLRPRVIDDEAAVDTRVSLFGETLPFPILLAPVAYQRVLHPDGELATARGAGDASATFVVSTGTTSAIEDIARVATSPLWFQLYVQSDRDVTRDLVRSAEDAGCRALVVTVDTPVIGARDRQLRAGFRLPDGVTTPHLPAVGDAIRDVNAPQRVTSTWRDIAWLCGISRVPVLLKGILSEEDADRAVGEGAAGLIVSNHGGRNLDTLPASVDALPHVASQVAGRVPVLMDGGIRRGTDVLKAMALGAAAVLVGRPYLYGLAAGGAAGVKTAVQILRRELEMALVLVGRSSLRDIDRSVLWQHRS
jgi:4-hydroxymandelate oxidase